MSTQDNRRSDVEPMERRRATIRPADASRGVRLIAAERQRQITQERWTPDHDDQHADGALVVAARTYIEAALNLNEVHGVEYETPSYDWPTGWAWKPSDNPVRNLVKAGALIAAEIDRLQRAALAAVDSADVRRAPCSGARLDDETCVCGHPGTEHDAGLICRICHTVCGPSPVEGGGTDG